MKTSTIKLSALMAALSFLFSAFFGCASAKMLKTAKGEWESGNYIESLQNAIAAVREDDNADAKLFLKDHYAEGIAASEQALQAADALPPIEKGNEKVVLLQQLIALNKAMATLSFPFTDKKATYSWQPETITDYRPQLDAVVRDAVAAYLDQMQTTSDWKVMVDLANEALALIPGEAVRESFKASVAALFFEKASAELQAADEATLTHAIEGFTLSQAWNPSDAQQSAKAESCITQAKTKIADLYYQIGIRLFEDNKQKDFNRGELKDALAAFKTANQWIEDYQSSLQNIQMIKRILAIYYYAVFPQEDDDLLSVDVRDAYFATLTPLLEEGSNVHTDKLEGDIHYATVLQPHILQEKPTSPYSYPAFIAAAEKAGVFYLTKADIAFGKEIADTEYTEKITDEVRDIVRKAVKIVKRQGIKKAESSVSLTKEEYDLFAAQIPEKGLSLQKALPALLELLAAKGESLNPESDKATLFMVDVPDKAPFKLMTNTFSYPLQVKYDFIDIRDYNKKVLLADLITQPVEGIYQQYIVSKDDALFKWVTDCPYTESREPLVTVDQSVITDEVLNRLFTQMNTDIAKQLNEFD